MGGGIQIPPIKQVIETEYRELRELRTRDDLLLNRNSFRKLNRTGNDTRKRRLVNKNSGPVLIGY